MMQDTINAMKELKVSKSLLRLLVPILAIGLLASCAAQDNEQADSALPTAVQGSLDEDTEITPEISGEEGPVTLTLWLPPIFSNFSGDLPTSLLLQRFDQFHEQNPNVQIDIRLKAEGEIGGMIDSLSKANVAAPLAIPDLLLLNNDQFEIAVEEELIISLDGRIDISSNEDWLAFGKQMTIAEGESYGLPFAGDALILIHRFSAIEIPPITWIESLGESSAIAFAANDQEALFAMLQYFGLLSNTEQASSLSAIDPNLTLQLLNYISEGQASGVFPFWLSQFENEEQSWQAFQEGRAPMVVAWSKRYFTSKDDNQGGGIVPSVDGRANSFVNAWAWAVSSQNTERQALALELAEFLTDAEFLAQWSSAAGFIPSRESALVAWAPTSKQALALQIADNAELTPSQEIRDFLGPIFSDAITSLLKQEITVNEANSQIQEQINSQ